MTALRLIESPQGHHWVMTRGDIVVAAGPDVAPAEARAQMEAILGGRVRTRLRHHDGWSWVFVDDEGRTIGRSLRLYADPDACLHDQALALASQMGKACMHRKRA